MFLKYRRTLFFSFFLQVFARLSKKEIPESWPQSQHQLEKEKAADEEKAASEESAVQFGIDCATKSVMRKGAQSSYPALKEINFSLISK